LRCHPGRSVAESRDPEAGARHRLGPGSATPSGMTPEP
ncbi:MAG: hypothetical protein ACOVMO_01620, partial [Caulobacter sp.]